MKTKRSMSAKSVVIVLLITMLLAACGENKPKVDTKEGSTKAKGSITIGMSQGNLGEPWLVQMNADVKMEADKHANVKVLYKDAQNDVLRQRSQLEEFISAGVDAIIINPIEGTPLTGPIAKAVAANIPIFVMDRRVDGDKYTQFIGTDNITLGYAVGKWMVEQYNGKKAKVVELEGLMTSTPGAERHVGFKKAIQGSDLEVIFAADVKWLEANARAEMESVLGRFNKVDVVFGGNDASAHGAYLAAKASARDKEMAFIGIDGLEQEGRSYVKDGILNATIYAPTGGDIAVQNALKIINGEKIEKDVLIDCVMYDKSNLDTGGKILNFPELKKK